MSYFLRVLFAVVVVIDIAFGTTEFFVLASRHIFMAKVLFGVFIAWTLVILFTLSIWFFIFDEVDRAETNLKLEKWFARKNEAN